MFCPTKFWKQRRRKKPIGRGFSKNDLKLVWFLWKWKLSPASCIYYSVCSEMSMRAFNRMLLKLQKNCIIECAFEPEEHFNYWQLTEWGVHCIRNKLEEVKNLGSHSAYQKHDLLSLLFVQGVWVLLERNYPQSLIQKPIITSEHELEKVHKENLNNGVKNLTARRPDGAWFYPDIPSPHTMALEVELSVKRPAQYEQIIQTYRHWREGSRILWMYEDPHFIEKFKQYKTNCHEESHWYHLFIKVDEFLEKGLHAILKDENGHEVVSVLKIMRGKQRVDLSEFAGTIEDKFTFADFFKPQKYLKLSKV